MQATEHGSLHNPVSDRQSVSVLVGWHALRGGAQADRVWVARTWPVPLAALFNVNLGMRPVSAEWRR